MSDWSGFLIALAAFFGAHSVPTRPRVKARIVDVIGARGFTLAYSLLSVALLVWLIRAAQLTPAPYLWGFSEAQAWITRALMLGACLVASYGLMSSNPLSFGGTAAPFDPQAPGIAGVSRHPILLALALWAVGHLVSNGQAALALLFVLMGGFALLGMPLIDRRKRREMGGDQWQALAAATSLIPCSALWRGAWAPQGAPRLLPLFVGLAVWAALIALHPFVIGVTAW